MRVSAIETYHKVNHAGLNSFRKHQKLSQGIPSTEPSNDTINFKGGVGKLVDISLNCNEIVTN